MGTELAEELVAGPRVLGGMARDPVGDEKGEGPVVEEPPAGAGGRQQVGFLLRALERLALVAIEGDRHRPLGVVVGEGQFHGRLGSPGGDVGEGELAYRLAFCHRRPEGDLSQVPAVTRFGAEQDVDDPVEQVSRVAFAMLRPAGDHAQGQQQRVRGEITRLAGERDPGRRQAGHVPVYFRAGQRVEPHGRGAVRPLAAQRLRGPVMSGAAMPAAQHHLRWPAGPPPRVILVRAARHQSDEITLLVGDGAAPAAVGAVGAVHNHEGPPRPRVVGPERAGQRDRHLQAGLGQGRQRRDAGLDDSVPGRRQRAERDVERKGEPGKPVVAAESAQSVERPPGGRGDHALRRHRVPAASVRADRERVAGVQAGQLVRRTRRDLRLLPRGLVGQSLPGWGQVAAGHAQQRHLVRAPSLPAQPGPQPGFRRDQTARRLQVTAQPAQLLRRGYQGVLGPFHPFELDDVVRVDPGLASGIHHDADPATVRGLDLVVRVLDLTDVPVRGHLPGERDVLVGKNAWVAQRAERHVRAEPGRPAGDQFLCQRMRPGRQLDVPRDQLTRPFHPLRLDRCGECITYGLKEVAVAVDERHPGQVRHDDPGRHREHRRLPPGLEQADLPVPRHQQHVGPGLRRGVVWPQRRRATVDHAVHQPLDQVSRSPGDRVGPGGRRGDVSERRPSRGSRGDLSERRLSRDRLAMIPEDSLLYVLTILRDHGWPEGGGATGVRQPACRQVQTHRLRGGEGGGWAGGGCHVGGRSGQRQHGAAAQVDQVTGAEHAFADPPAVPSEPLQADGDAEGCRGERPSGRLGVGLRGDLDPAARGGCSHGRCGEADPRGKHARLLEQPGLEELADSEDTQPVVTCAVGLGRQAGQRGPPFVQVVGPFVGVVADLGRAHGMFARSASAASSTARGRSGRSRWHSTSHAVRASECRTLRLTTSSRWSPRVAMSCSATPTSTLPASRRSSSVL